MRPAFIYMFVPFAAIMTQRHGEGVTRMPGGDDVMN